MKKSFLIILGCMILLFLSYLFFAISGFNDFYLDHKNDDINRIYFILRMFRDCIIFSLLVNILLIVFSSILKKKEIVIYNLISFIISIVSLVISNIYIKDLKEPIIIFLSIMSLIICCLGIIQFITKKEKNNVE